MKPLMNTLLFLSEILGLPIIYLLSCMSQIGSEKVDRTSMALFPGFGIWFLCIALLFYKHLYGWIKVLTCLSIGILILFVLYILFSPIR